MKTIIREMAMTDYDTVLALWQSVEGIGLRDSDAADQIGLFLSRNPGLSFVAVSGENLVGAVLCGHDGRRGYIHHLAVSPDYRRSGIGGRLVQRCLQELKSQGIRKCHLFVFRSNHDAITFWEKSGWIQREEIGVMSKFIS